MGTMSGRRRRFALTAFLLLMASATRAGDIPRFAAGAPGVSTAAVAKRPPQAAYDINALPVYFEKDPARDRYQTRTANAGLIFDKGGFWLGIGDRGESVRVSFRGARHGATPIGQGPLAAHSNYFVGRDQTKWSVRQHFAGVEYSALWPDIDAAYYAKQNQLEYDFNVGPHANPSRIVLQVDGADSVRIDEQGELRISSKSGETRQRRPNIYQEIDGRRIEIAGGYRLAGKRRVGFWVGDYDKNRRLVIDPVLQFSTLLGGSGYDVATAIAVDSSSNIYVTGYTQFADFQVTPAGQRFTRGSSAGPNVFVVKIDGVTHLIDYLDFWGGSVSDLPLEIAMDSGGNSWVVGSTSSPDIPLVHPFLSAPQLLPVVGSYGFVATFDPNGNLIYSTYAPPGSLYGVTVNSAGTVWVVGQTICLQGFQGAQYHEFAPTSGAAQPSCASPTYGVGYIMQLSSSGLVQYSTYWVPTSGNSDNSGLSDIGVDAQNNTYVAGTMIGPSTVTRVFQDPNTGQYFDGSAANLICEVTKFNSSGQPQWTQTLQGSADQECLRIAVDKNANAYITGYTTSTNLTTSSGAFQKAIGSTGTVPNVDYNPLGNLSTRPLWDGFAAAFNTNGGLVYSTYLGGTGDDYGFGIAVNGSGNSYITGYTNSPNFPVTPGATQTTYGGGQGDAYITVVSADGTQLVSSTFLGGSGQDEGYQTAVDQLGNAYLVGGTASADLPFTSDAIESKVQLVDGFVAKVNLQTCNPSLAVSSPVLSAAAGTASLKIATDVAGCAWNLSTTSPWITFTPASGSGNTTVTLNITANATAQSRLAIINANSRKTFVYQSGLPACQFVFTPGEMALSASSARELMFVQTSDPTCTWTATSDQSWLHILSSAGGPGPGTITIGTDANTGSSARTAHLTVGSQTLNIGQSAGGCVATLSAASTEFGPAGGLGTVTVQTSSSSCPWQASTTSPAWIQLPQVGPTGSYGHGTVRFSILPNTSTASRFGTITVSGQNVNITQDPVFNDLRSDTPAYTSTSASASSIGSAPPIHPGGQLRTSLTPRSAVRPLRPENLGNCGSKSPSSPFQLDPKGDAITVTITRTAGGCNPVATSAQPGWLTVTGPTSAGGNNVSFTISASSNSLNTTRNAVIGVNPGDSSQLQPWYWTVNQSGLAAAPLSIQSPQELMAQASSTAIGITSANSTITSCNWSVDSSTVPDWIHLGTSTGVCGSQLQFNYDANGSNSTRTAKLQFTSGDFAELDQPAPASTPCTFSFQQTTPQSIGASGGTVTLNVLTTSSCTWAPSTDSPGWITFPTGSYSGSGAGTLAVTVAANATTSQQMAQVYVGGATAYISQGAGSFPTGCVYTLSPTSQSIPNSGGSYSFQVQTTNACTWQPTQPTADASYIHLQSTASVTGTGSVSFTVDVNPAGSPPRSSSIGVAQGVTFSISQDAGATPGCSYTLNPSSTSLQNTGGSFAFQVQTTASCQWHPQTSATWIHFQSSVAVTGPGTITFMADANPSGSAARSASIAVGSSNFTVNEAAGIPGGPAPTFTASNLLNSASYQQGAVSPGEIVTIFGSNLGPSTGAQVNLVNNSFPISASGVQVTFNGTPAALLYVSAGQINAVAPYSLSPNSSAQVQVTYNNAQSSLVTVPVSVTTPALFTQASGRGLGAFLKSDYSLISASNPAQPGDIVILFGTGAGQTNPAGKDGVLAAAPYPSPVQPVSVTMGGVQSSIVYSGDAPGLVAGLLQVNATVPAGLQGTQPVVLTIGGVSSPAGVTIPLKGTAPTATGTLSASPNPLNVCSATATATVTLSWSTANVNAVQIVAVGQSTPIVANGGPSGTVTVTGAPNVTYNLINLSGAVASSTSLASVTLQQGTCPAQPGVAPPTSDLAQNVSNWQVQLLNNGANAGGGAQNDTSPSDILDGSSSMYVFSTSATTILLTQNAPSSTWDFSKISNVLLSLQSDISPGYWQASPSFKLTSANGSLSLTPTSSVADNSYYGWVQLAAPLAGNSTWKAATSGQFNIQNVTSIQVSLNVNGINWAALLNAMFLK